MSAPVAWNQTWDVGVWTGEAIGVSIGPSNPNARLTMAGFEVSRVIRRSWAEGDSRPILEYVFEAAPLFLVTRPQTVYGGGFSPLGVRWKLRRPRQIPALSAVERRRYVHSQRCTTWPDC